MTLRELSWSAVRVLIHAAFPEVAHLSTADLAAELARADGPPLLLFDVRTAAEYAVSHLPGAVRIEPYSDPHPLVAGVAAERSIVTYCSVGYRSGGMARAIAAAGHHRVRNLDGSIFAWANEGRRLERDGRTVQLVHPYDAIWGLLLEPARRSPVRP